MPKAFSEHEKEVIHQRLLERGYELFTAYGLKKTNVEELAQAAGISKGAFYLFYPSKEALFMDVIEQVEIRMRKAILAMIDLPADTPRARLYAILHKAFALFESMPILRFFTGGDYDVLFRRLPQGKLQEHLAGDLAFIEELITQCRNAGIPIQVRPEQIVGLLYPLVLAILHQGDLGRNAFAGGIDVLLELIAAYCLGEIELHPQSIGDASLVTQKVA